MNLSDLVNTFQNAVQALNTIADAVTAQVAHFTSGQMAVDTLVLPGFVRVRGVSVVTAGAAGGLYDSATLAGASSTTQVYTVPATAGFIATDMIFTSGLVYKPGAGQVAAIFYART